VRKKPVAISLLGACIVNYTEIATSLQAHAFAVPRNDGVVGGIHNKGTSQSILINNLPNHSTLLRSDGVVRSDGV
jgi:hypothetical protein